MTSRFRNIPDQFARRLIRQFEGGSIYASETDNKFQVIVDQGTLLDLLNDEDRKGFDSVTVYEFDTAVARHNFLLQRGWVPIVNVEQHAFLDAQIFSMSLMATVQRNKHLYQDDVSDESKRAFHAALREELRHLVERYTHVIDEPEHVQNVADLAARVSKDVPYALKGGELKIGAAQKVLNLYLKYMWCMGKVPAPPHCPFDSAVLKTVGWRGEGWTMMNDVKTYVQWASLAKAKAALDGISLPEWELTQWNKLQLTL